MTTGNKKEAYYKLRSEAWDLIINAQHSYDKSIISLSTVALGFVFAISRNKNEKIIPLDRIPIFHLTNQCTFISVLALLISSILLTMISFWFDQCYGQSVITQANQSQSKNNRGFCYMTSMITKILSGACFIGALILYSIYIYTNLEFK